MVRRQEPLTTTYRWYLATWAKRLSWTEVGAIFRTSWDSMCRAVEHAVAWAWRTEIWAR